MEINRKIKTLIGFFYDLSLKIKLLILFSLFSAILILGVGAYSYKISSGIIVDQTDVYSTTILHQIKDRINEIKDEVLQVSIPMVTNPSIQNNDLESLDPADFMNRKNNIDSELSLIMLIKRYICSIYLCYENNNILSSESVSGEDLINFKKYGVYRKAMDLVTKPVWIGIHENEFIKDKNRNVFSFTRSLYDIKTFTPFGVLVLNIPGNILDDICGDNYNVFILDKSGQIVYEKPVSAGLDSSDPSLFKEIIGSKNSGELTWKSGNNKYKIQYLTSELDDWIYVMIVPIDFMTKNAVQVRNGVILILVIGVLLSIIGAYLISAFFTVPFQKMIKTMKKVQKGDFNIRLDISNKSEIGQLADNYKIMVDEIKNLVQKIKQESHEKREAELNALQAQITPHFLYNTLNSIKAIAKINKITSIEEMTVSLIELLRLSISKKKTFITIEEEIEITKKYVFIQNFRHGNRFTVDFDCEEDIFKYMTIKMILQPIVENAIIHGLEPRNGSGHIVIRAYGKGHTICFEVEDNGIGMDEEKINSILVDEAGSDRRFSGIGVKNINERIILHFGPSYGITMKSIPGEYTKTLITIPAITQKEVDSYV